MIAAIATVAESASTKDQVVVVAYYSQPGQQSKLDAQLLNLLQNVRVNHAKTPIVCCGDFNRPVERMGVLSETLGLSCMLQQTDTITRTQRRLSEISSSQTDYVLSNKRTHLVQTIQPPVETRLDHIPL